MKKNLQTMMLIVVFAMITFGTTICAAQPRVGGYTAASKTDETVIEAATFAVETQAQNDQTLELVSIERAERQIVSGSNYRLCLTVTSNGKTEQASATVYLNLRSEFSLSEWQAGKCVASKSVEVETADDESETFSGTLTVGKTDSVILYFGEESGDYAAFCFTNNSAAGRAILKACKNNGQCEFSGKIDYDKPCKAKGLEANLSASGKILSVKSVKNKVATNAMVSKSLAPDVVVKNLYAAQKNPKDAPFFQTTNRAAVDNFFKDDLADLIWNDAVEANGEAGTINFDPLYDSQDQKITAFVISKPVYADDIATVTVSFRNFGKAEKIKFILEIQANKTWKIIDIGYKNGNMLNSMLFDAKLAAESEQ